MDIEKIKDKVFQAVMSDIGKHYKVSDRLSDILCDSLSEHLPTSITQALAEDRERVRGEIEGVIGLKYKLFGAAGCSRDEEIKEELREAKDPRTVLDRFSSLTINGVGFAGSGGNWDTELLLPDTVFQYTEDILGRKVYQTIRDNE